MAIKENPIMEMVCSNPNCNHKVYMHDLNGPNGTQPCEEEGCDCKNLKV